jgi:subtilisin family serine protease
MKWIERTVTLLVALTSSMAYATNYRHDQIIVKAQSLKTLKNLKSNGVRSINSINSDLGLYLVEVMPSLHKNFEYDLQALQDLGEIEYWQRDHILSRRTLNDPLYQNQWSLNKQNNKSDIQIAEAWKITTGKSDVVVAVVDGGVDVTHEDLQGNLWINQLEIPGNGKDDDGNGYIDDVNGWDFLGSLSKDIKYDNLEMTRQLRDYKNRFGNKSSKEVAKVDKADYKKYKALEEKFNKEKFIKFMRL